MGWGLSYGALEGVRGLLLVTHPHACVCMCVMCGLMAGRCAGGGGAYI